MATSKHDSYSTKTFSSVNVFHNWLEKNHSTAEGIWVKIAKAGSGFDSVSHAEALDEALCYGWIDGLRRGFDKDYFLQKFTPRTKNSIWSVINKKKVAALIKEGRMSPAGLAAIEVAKKNGRWKSAYRSSKTIAVPVDLKKALDSNVKAKTFFAKLSAQNRYAILFRIGQVKRAETRVKKIEQFIKMLEEHKTVYSQ